MSLIPQSQRPTVRYVVQWRRLTEMLALTASAGVVIGYLIWGG